MSETLFAGIDHAAIAARDPVGLADWYCEILGFRMLADNGKDRPTRILAGTGGGMIEMMPDDETARPERDLFDPGISHLAVRVSSLEDAVSRLKAAGVEVAEPVPAAGGGLVATFKDPEGNVLQVVERPAGFGR
jgi:glyoxylase I family protein